MSGLLEYDRLAIASGELWRLITGHFVHWDAEHLLFSGGSFALLAWALARREARLAAWTVALSIGAVSSALWLAAPQIVAYRGLSGPATALAAALLLDLGAERWRRRRRPSLAVTIALGAALVAKLAVELGTGGFVFSHSGYTAAPVAHLAGGIAGVFTWLTVRRGPVNGTSTAGCRRRGPGDGRRGADGREAGVSPGRGRRWA